MNQNELILKLQSLPKEIRGILHDVAIITGKQAVDMFKDNFQKESYNGKPWLEVKRRQDSRNFKVLTRGKNKGQSRATNAAGSRKILTGETGDLGESIKYKYLGKGEVSIYSDKPYAAAHNEGTRTAGRGNSTTIPQRQFMGPSPELDSIVKREIEKKLNNIFK
jgi:phage gpG-like protein